MIQGEIHTFPLHDLIQWLGLTRRTGKLVVAQGADSVELYLADSGATLETYQVPSNRRMSVEFYFVAGELAADSVAKVRTMLSTALAWRSGRFAFSAGQLPMWILSTDVRLKAEALLLEVAAELEQKRQASPKTDQHELTEVGGRSETFTLADELRLQVVDLMLKEDFSVPAMPQLAARVLEMTRDENFSLRALGNLVLTDPAVAARVLRYANSVLRGGERSVDSLGLAVQRLGADEVVNIVLAASLQARRLGRDPFAAEKRRLWTHALVAAFFARVVASKAAELNPNLGFLCGLLMDFGMTVLYSLTQEVLAQRASSAPIPAQVVGEIVRDYHPRVGRVVGEKWRLPSAVVEAMAYHHCLDAAATDSHYVAVAALADFLATYVLNLPRLNLEQSLAGFPPEQLASHPAARHLNLSASEAAAVLAELPWSLDQALKNVVD